MPYAEEHFPLKAETGAILGAAFEVYREKGCGFVEPVYQEGVEIELELQKIPFIPQACVQLEYKGRPLTQSYKPDLMCYGAVVVELKALKDLTDQHRAQVHNYLKASGYEVGLLINFGHYPKAQYERIIRSRK